MNEQALMCFSVFGRRALFSDPISRVGGEKCSYQVPTFDALRGIAESIYWKPTFNWVVKRVRVMKPIQTDVQAVRPLTWPSGSSLANYTYLFDVEYQVEVALEWNEDRPDLKEDRNLKKHMDIARRALKAGGRRDVFLGTRECQAYVEPCEFGEGVGHYDNIQRQDFGLMLHGCDYPGLKNGELMYNRFWLAFMKKGVITFPHPDDRQSFQRRFLREASMRPETPILGVDKEWEQD